jgi:hypothetical protein
MGCRRGLGAEQSYPERAAVPREFSFWEEWPKAVTGIVLTDSFITRAPNEENLGPWTNFLQALFFSLLKW